MRRCLFGSRSQDNPTGQLISPGGNRFGFLSGSNFGLKTITNFAGNGLAAPANPAAKTAATCFIIIDVNNGKFVRDPSTPSGFTCSGTFFH